VDASWYVTNYTLHYYLNVLNVTYIRDEIRKLSQRYANRMEEHSNILTKNLLRNIKTKALTKKKTFTRPIMPD